MVTKELSNKLLSILEDNGFEVVTNKGNTWETETETISKELFNLLISEVLK